MKALLVFPQESGRFWSFQYAFPYSPKRAFSPPLGLLTVAALLPSSWSKNLIDMNVRELTADDLAWCDLVMLSATVSQRRSVEQVIARCQQAGKVVVAGGPLFTLEPEAFAAIDHLVLNEAELTLPPFLEDLERGCARHIYATDQFADLENTPIPLWDLIDLQQYVLMPVQYARGCPYHCEFCSVTAMLGRKVRTKRPEQILAELDSLVARGWNEGVFWVDDNLIGNRPALRNELLPALIEWRRRNRWLPFHGQASINLAEDESLMDALAQAGINKLAIGIESTNPDSLRETHKTTNLERDLLASVHKIQEHGIEVSAGFVMGFDHDTPEVFQKTEEFLQQSGILIATISMLNAYKHTPLYERLEKEGRILGPVAWDPTEGKTNIIPRMGKDELEQGFQRFVKRIYSVDLYNARVRVFLDHFKRPRIRGPIKMWQLRMFYRLLKELLVEDRYASDHRRLLRWALLHRIHIFQWAAASIQFGRHMRKVYGVE